MEIQGMVACPVCTLYLREGMSMHSHLDTHPKDQVIEALVRMYSSERSMPYPHSPASSIVGSFLPVVSEEHVASYKLQQVTSVIHQPILPYPVYSHQPPYIPAGHYLPEPPQESSKTNLLPLESTDMASNSVINLSQVQDYSTHVDNGMISHHHHGQGSVGEPMVRHMDHLDINQEDSVEVFKPEVLFVTPNVEDEEIVESPPTSPRSAISVRTDLTDQRNHHESEMYEEYILSDCNYQDEAARHADQESSKNQDLDGHMDLRVETRDQSLATEERMPPQGEITDPSPRPEWVHHVANEEPLSNENVWDLRSDHSEKKHEENKYPCLYCDESLETPTDRRVHIANVHSSTPQVKTDKDKKQVKLSKVCTKCDRTFPSLKTLREHNKIEHPRALKSCDICHEVFMNKKTYIQHLVNIHPLECKICGKTFTKPNSLTLHLKTHMNVKPHVCHLCPKSFVTPQKLKEHINGHTGAAPIRCDMCPRTFKRYSNLKQHKDITHFKVKKKKKDFFCHCGESFQSKKKLARHEETHNVKPKQCPFCNEKFVYVTSLTRHIRRTHDSHYLPKLASNKAKNVQCPVCNLTMLETSLASHMKYHSEHKKFSCAICGKKFHKKWNLHLHKWTHASRISKPYKCNLCKGAFIRFGDFQAHLRSHLGHKPFTCNHCGMQFIRKQNWQRHEREHSGIKTHACPECGKTFFRSYYLAEHLRVHNGQKPFTCHICNKMSTTKSNHNKHLKTHHAREVLNTEG